MSNSDASKAKLIHEAKKMESAIRNACGTGVGSVDSELFCRSVSILNPADPVTADQDAPLEEVCQLLTSHSIGCVLITNSAEELVGVFSERDYMTRVFQKIDDIQERSVSEFMTANPITVEPDTPIAFCMHLMSKGGFRHLPVVDPDGMPISIISVRDLIDFLVRQFVVDLEGLVGE